MSILPYFLLGMAIYISGVVGTVLSIKHSRGPIMVPPSDEKAIKAVEFNKDKEFDEEDFKKTINEFFGSHGKLPIIHIKSFKSAEESAEVFSSPPPDEVKTDYLTPKNIKEILDRSIVGQEKAKKKIAVAVSNHYKRIKAPVDGVKIKKANIMLVGPTGSGKTLIVSKLAKIMGVPFTHADATSYTQAGYVGKDVEHIIKDLYTASGNMRREAEHGIVFVDEIDKLASHYHTGFRDVAGKGVQQAFLKLIESETIDLGAGWGEFDLSNVLFIFGGAFAGLSDQMKERRKESTIGFSASVKSDNQESETELFRQIQPQDIVEFGMVPEFMGRIPTIAVLEGLTEEQLVQVLTEPDDAIVKEYEALFNIDGIKIIFDPKALDLVAKKAIELKTGARALRSVMEDLLLDTMYELDTSRNVVKIKITEEYTKKHLKMLI